VLTSDPKAQFEELKEQLLTQISGTFPIKDRSGRFEVRVSGLTVDDHLGTDDIKGQAKARLEGKSWAVPVLGTIEVVDTKENKTVVSRPNALIAKIPKLTRHYSYIMGGQEKSIANQWRLRPGAYVKATEKPGEYEAQFQLAKGRSFDVQLDESGYIHMKVGSRKIPLYSVLSTMGVTDEAMKKAWGESTFHASKSKASVDKNLRSLYEVWRKEAPASTADLRNETHAIFESTKLDPEVAHANLGVRTSQVNAALLFEASKKLLDVSAGRKDPDPIDSLRYKELWSAKDHFMERIAQASPEITRRVQQALSKPTVQRRLASGDRQVLRDVFMPDLIQRPLNHVFTTSLTSVGKQTNPLTMISDNNLVTITGPGGIQNQHALSKSNTALDPSHLGFLDPVYTPESNTGVNTHKAFGVTVKDRKPHIRLYNLRTGKLEDVDAARASVSSVILPDQVVWKGGKPTPRGKTTRMSDGHGQIRDDLPWGDAHYVMPSATQVFTVETNLVPFMQNDSAGRSTMSARHMAQAISITGREAPKVQVEAGAGRTFEDLVGSGFLARKSPEAGVVVSVKPGEVVIRGKSGTHTVDLYDHYPTNHSKGELHSTPLVKPGDKVKAGEIVADNNYTKGGKLALGTNLRVAYIANGSNHEDGIVISESAAKKLSSEHLHKPSMLVTDNHTVDKKSFIRSKGTVFGLDKLNKIGDDGIVRVGTKVHPGDPLVLALNEDTRLIATGPRAAAKIGKRLRERYDNASMVWDSDHVGEVVRAQNVGGQIVVHVKTLEPIQVGSKLSTRHSAKGIVASILPDKEMPHDAESKHVEILINPVSVPGRINPGQILETAAGRIAEKTGKAYVVKNFQGGVDYLKKLQGELKSHGLKDTEALYDPKTGRKLGDITVGPHYVFQLEHQIDKKTHVRSGGPSFPALGTPKLHYDANTQIPRGGGHNGAQSLGSLGIYAALASGLHDNLKEMQTLKSDQSQAHAVWAALTNGAAVLPKPQIPFVYKKFEAMLTAMGTTVKNEGGTVRIIPRTDAETLALSRGEIKRPTRTLRGKDDRPEPGGLFDPHITGGSEGGTHWGHIRLHEPMPNPIHARAISRVLGIQEADISDIIEGKKKLPGGQYGGRGFREALSKINVDKELKDAKDALKDPKIKEAALEKAHFKYHALRTLKELGVKPADAWTIQNVPVIPPIFRPQTTKPDGTINNNPLNALYRRLGVTNESLKHGEKIPFNATLDAQAGLYQELRNLFGTTPKGKKALDLDMRGTREDRSKKLPGILHMLSGEQPKDGFFQDKIIAKKQDYTSRATITVDPDLGVDEVGVPKKIAAELYRPFIVSRLIRSGVPGDKAQIMVSQKAPLAIKALEQEIKNRPLLMKRDPVLHQYGLVGQNVKLTDDPAVKLSPLVLPPLNADIDGDTVALMVPLTHAAVEETRRIVPSQRIISESSGDVLYAPSNESALALYRMSVPRGAAKGKAFKTKDEAEKAFKESRVQLNETIHIQGVGDTTLGRARVAAVVPEKYRTRILTDLKAPFDKKFQAEILHDTAKSQPKHFVELADNLSRLGFQMAYESGHTVTLKDLEPLRDKRDQIVAAAQKKVNPLMAQGKTDEVTQHWLDATRKLHDTYSTHFANHPTNVSDMAVSGIKAKREQYQGLVMAPMLVEDHLGRPSKVPITKSFAEGIDLGGYFLQAAGARRALIQKTDSVREPGYMSKLLVQANIDQPITGADCGTPQGMLMPIKNKDVVDRHLAAPLKLGAREVPAGTVVTPDLLAHAEKAKVDRILVRSPLKCRMPHGVCSKCMGVHPSGGDYHMGENVGIIAAQALGERAAQLMLRQTHGGGIVSTKGTGMDEFSDVHRLFAASKRSREDAAVAPSTGVVSSVEKTRQGTWNIYIDKKKNPLVSRQRTLDHVKPGYSFSKGEVLTHGEPNIHDLLSTKGLDAVQSHMVDRIGGIYGREGVLRRHAELAVRTATSVVRVQDPGAHDSYVRGDFVTKPVLDEINRTVLKGKKPIEYESHLIPASMIPLRSQPDWMGRLQGERITQSVLTAIQHGHTSTPGGRHPIPGLAIGVAAGRAYGTAQDKPHG